MPRRNRLPHHRQRDRVLHMVREHDGAVDAVELAAQIGLHVTTVRFHLDALCDEGLIVRTRLGRAGAGRPRTGYRAVEQRLDYRILAEVLSRELGQTAETRARRAQWAGEKWAARLTASHGGPADDSDGDPLDRAAAHATELFTRMGFEPEMATAAEPLRPSGKRKAKPRPARIIALHACPVRDLAKAHPEVGCAVHLGLLRGLLPSEPALSAELEPFVEPELCMARLVAL